MGITDRVKARAKHPTGGAVTGRIASHDPRKHARVNQAAGWVGHEKRTIGTSIDDANAHSSAPLSTLQDPSSFGPPPKHVNYHSEAAASASSSPVTAHPPALPSSSKPVTPKPVASRPAPQISRTGGLGAPIPKPLLLTQEEQEEEEAAKPPPMPYRLDTTGLTVDNLPKPPVRRADSSEMDVRPRTLPIRAAAKPKPQPPPRLPARQNSTPTEFTPPPPPVYPVTDPGPQSHQPAAPTSMGQLSELQSRFNKLPGRVSSPPAQPPRPATQSQNAASPTLPEQSQGQGTGPSTGTTWAQKQAALRTASQFNNDPSSVSASDAHAAADTARDFHQRHGEQVASGWQRAKDLDSKYGVRGKVGGVVQGHGQFQQAGCEDHATHTNVDPISPASNGNNIATKVAAASKKPPPPPPPPKKKALQDVPAASSAGGDSVGPPPIPLSSKPSR